MYRVSINGREYSLTTQQLQRARKAGTPVTIILGGGV